MVKVITYGTYDLLHYGHIRLLERAKALGDYLIVGVTADDFDKTRGKINVQQSLIERIEAVRDTGLADEIIVEEYEGQKIDDIRRYGVDIFTVGSDWEGKFDYLKEYCRVVYLERTEGISSSDLRDRKRALRFGIIGERTYVNKVAQEASFVNGIDISGICADHLDVLDRKLKELPLVTESPEELIDAVDAVYIHSHPAMHYEQVKLALQQGKHVLCEAPFALNRGQTEELFGIAQEKKLILMEGIKTAYSTAYERLLLLAKTGKIGDIVNVQATCTSLRQPETLGDTGLRWNSICEWGPTALLPIFQLLGTEYRSKSIVTRLKDSREKYDDFTKVDFLFPHAAGSILVGKGIKSEGELVISGTKGYIYVPAPWWKTDYFEIRYENPENNRRYFYQLDGEGIRYELVAFVRSAEKGQSYSAIEKQVTAAIDNVIADFYRGIDVTKL